jgi:hypothetical protein
VPQGSDVSLSLTTRSKRWLARALPGLLLVATFFDDPLFGGAMVSARLAFGTIGLIVVSIGFVGFSIAMAAATIWVLRVEPLRLSLRNSNRIAALQRKRLGRFLIPRPERPLTTAVGAAVFGSVMPVIVAALDPRSMFGHSYKMALIAGTAYGLAFAASYGLLATIIGTAV